MLCVCRAVQRSAAQRIAVPCRGWTGLEERPGQQRIGGGYVCTVQYCTCIHSMEVIIDN